MNIYGSDYPRKLCILDCDSPSYAVETLEYAQCSCVDCLKHLASKGYNIIRCGKIIEPRTAKGSLD